MTEQETVQFEGSDFWDSAYDGAAEMGTGGVIGKMNVDIGYKVYVTGFTGDEQEKTFFPVDGKTKKDRDAARALARNFATANGLAGREARPDYVALLRMYHDECVNAGSGEPVTWTGDQLKTVALWTLRADGESAGKVFMTAVKENQITPKKDFYGRAVWVPDPYKVALGDAGKTDEDADGNPRVPMFPIVAQVYENKDAATAAALAAGVNGAAPVVTKWDDFPGEWGDDNWVKLADDYEMRRDTIDDLGDYVDEEFGMTVPWFIRVLNTAGRDDDEIIALTGLAKSDVKKALR